MYEVCDGEDKEVKYFCACNKCFKVYQYKDSNGKHYGTRNLLEHSRKCVAGSRKSQLQIHQCVPHKVQLSKGDASNLKRKAVQYCVNGYHSFRAVEHEGLVDIMQLCVDYGAKYGKFRIADEMVKRNAVAREASSLAGEVKQQLASRLKDPVEDGTVSLTVDMYTDDYRKKSYLDIHASWIDRDFTFHHSALAVRHFGTDSHTGSHVLLHCDTLSAFKSEVEACRFSLQYLSQHISLPPALLNCNCLVLSNPGLKLICFQMLSVNCSTYLFAFVAA